MLNQIFHRSGGDIIFVVIKYSQLLFHIQKERKSSPFKRIEIILISRELTIIDFMQIEFYQPTK